MLDKAAPDPNTRAPIKPGQLAMRTGGQGSAWALVWSWALEGVVAPELLPVAVGVATSIATAMTLAAGNAVRTFRTANQQIYRAGSWQRLLLDLTSFL